mmetsp:Transcript_9263/g.20727  ORF Transcript_9263/g.20727 Transcript_9263/m.20727 type:complete len:203 (-) Transcript_9263:2288-2896(-)
MHQEVSNSLHIPMLSIATEWNEVNVDCDQQAGPFGQHFPNLPLYARCSWRVHQQHRVRELVARGVRGVIPQAGLPVCKLRIHQKLRAQQSFASILWARDAYVFQTCELFLHAVDDAHNLVDLPQLHLCLWCRTSMVWARERRLTSCLAISDGFYQRFLCQELLRSGRALHVACPGMKVEQKLVVGHSCKAEHRVVCHSCSEH